MKIKWILAFILISALFIFVGKFGGQKFIGKHSEEKNKVVHDNNLNLAKHVNEINLPEPAEIQFNSIDDYAIYYLSAALGSPKQVKETGNQQTEVILNLADQECTVTLVPVPISDQNTKLKENEVPSPPQQGLYPEYLVKSLSCSKASPQALNNVIDPMLVKKTLDERNNAIFEDRTAYAKYFLSRAYSRVLNRTVDHKDIKVSLILFNKQYEVHLSPNPEYEIKKQLSAAPKDKLIPEYILKGIQY